MRRLKEKRQDAPPKFSATGGRDLKGMFIGFSGPAIQGKYGNADVQQHRVPPLPPPEMERVQFHGHHVWRHGI